MVGAGLYCDNRYGAAACTGHGERTIRGATAHAAVQYMESGLTAEAAATRAIENLPPVTSAAPSVVVLMVTDAEGRHCCVSNSTKAWDYLYMGDGDSSPRTGRTRVIA
jgi:beta-aspartyl-peptidase (threonine type)